MSIVHRVKDWLTGGGEQGGPVDALLNVSPIGLGAAALIGGSAALDGGVAEGAVGAGRMMGAEGIMGFAGRAFDLATDYTILTDWRGFSGKIAQSVTGENSKLSAKAEAGVISHALYLSQLKSIQSDVPTLYEDYKALGLNLPKPDSEVFINATRKLRSVARRDLAAEAEGPNSKTNPLAAELNVATAHLKDAEVHKAYNEELEHNRATLEEEFTKKSSFDWKDTFKAIGPEMQLGYDGAWKKPSKAMQWVSERSGLEKTGLAFAVVGGVALVGYGIAKIADNKSKKEAATHAARVQKNTPETVASLG